MLYRVRLEKDTYWWDEDEIGSCVFPAEDDEDARQIITTLVTRMNRQYWRMGEPRFVRIGKLTNIDTQTADERNVCITWMVPLSGLARIRHCLEFFYPKVENSRRRDARMSAFFNTWKVHPFPIKERMNAG